MIYAHDNYYFEIMVSNDFVCKVVRKVKYIAVGWYKCQGYSYW